MAQLGSIVGTKLESYMSTQLAAKPGSILANKTGFSFYTVIINCTFNLFVNGMSLVRFHFFIVNLVKFTIHFAIKALHI